METMANPLAPEAQTRVADDDEPQQPLLEAEFTPSQVEALRAAFGQDAVQQAPSKQPPDESTEDVVARLKETPCNWHQATVFAMSVIHISEPTRPY